MQASLLLLGELFPLYSILVAADSAGNVKRKMAIAIAIRPVKWGPSLVPKLAALAFSDDDDDVGVGVAVEIFVKIAASGEPGASPNSSVQSKRHDTKLAIY